MSELVFAAVTITVSTSVKWAAIGIVVRGDPWRTSALPGRWLMKVNHCTLLNSLTPKIGTLKPPIIFSRLSTLTIHPSPKGWFSNLLYTTLGLMIKLLIFLTSCYWWTKDAFTIKAILFRSTNIWFSFNHLILITVCQMKSSNKKGKIT